MCVCFVAPCGGTISGESGVIESIGYPTLSYPNNLFCQWHLRGLPGHYLTIHFEDFNLQSSPGCAKDFVEIWENHTAGEWNTTFLGDVYFFTNLFKIWSIFAFEKGGGVSDVIREMQVYKLWARLADLFHDSNRLQWMLIIVRAGL